MRKKGNESFGGKHAKRPKHIRQQPRHLREELRSGTDESVSSEESMSLERSLPSEEVCRKKRRRPLKALKRSPVWTAWNWIWPVGLGVLAAKILSAWVIGFAYVPSASMVPAIQNPGHILLDHLATEWMPIYEGEVVVFHWPDDPTQIFVKRVIGLPGDTIFIRNGHVYRNGKELNEPYLHGLYTAGNYGPYHVPAGHYFMMGDNRNISDDSRDWVHKYVPKSFIIARADFEVWPPSKIHQIPQ